MGGWAQLGNVYRSGELVASVRTLKRRERRAPSDGLALLLGSSFSFGQIRRILSYNSCASPTGIRLPPSGRTAMLRP